MAKRKLIEVALPLEAINQASDRDGPKRKNHPWRMHYWWARRKLATARAVLFAQLVDDPSSRPDEFPTEELQRAERERLHDMITRLADWDGAHNTRLLSEARAEILKSADGKMPKVLDPFAGGGSIPLEAQRLGLEAHASDLNPVAVLINRALIEIPATFRGKPPVFPQSAESANMRTWNGAEGLASDVRSYGKWIAVQATERVGSLYPPVQLAARESPAPALAWIWARTVECPNPACGIDMPLVRSWWLSKRKGRETFVVPSVTADASHQSGLRVQFSISTDKANGPTTATDGTVGRSGARCVACESPVPLEHIRSSSRRIGLGRQLMAVIAEGNRRRNYIEPDDVHRQAADVAVPDDVPSGELFDWPGRINVFRYGLTQFSDLFTPRQLVALTTLSDLVQEARERVLIDSGDTDYADAVATYLGLSVSRGSDYQSNITTWHYQNEQIRNVFARQAIPMAWDFLEVNPLGSGSGTWTSQYELAAQALDGLNVDVPGFARQSPAQVSSAEAMVISTDPPTTTTWGTPTYRISSTCGLGVHSALSTLIFYQPCWFQRQKSLSRTNIGLEDARTLKHSSRTDFEKSSRKRARQSSTTIQLPSTMPSNRASQTTLGTRQVAGKPYLRA